MTKGLNNIILLWTFVVGSMSTAYPNDIGMECKGKFNLKNTI